MTTRQARAGTTSSWQRYRMIADNSSDVVYETTPDGVIRWVSPAIEQLLGYAPSEFRGTLARDHVHPDDLAMVDELRLTVYAGSELDEIPCRFRRADGTYRDCTMRARPVRGADGAIIGAVTALRDSHEKTAALRALATLSRSNAALFRERDESGLLQAMCDAAVDAGEFLAVAYVRTTPEGVMTPVAMAGPLVTELEAIRARDPAAGGLTREAFRTGETQVTVAPATDPRTSAFTALTRDHCLHSGIALPVRAPDVLDGVLVAVSSDPHAFDTHARQLLEDLTADLGYGIERIRESAELLASQAREEEHKLLLAGILDAQLDPLVLLAPVRDAAGRIVDLRYVEANTAALRYNQRSADEQLGLLFSEIHPELFDLGVAQRYMQVIETGVPVVLDDYSYANPNVGHEQRRYDIRAVKTGDGVTLTWRDVTERFLAAQRVSESEHRYRILTENASDIVWETSADGTMAWVSESVTRVLG